MTFHYRYRRQILLGAFGILFILGIGWFILTNIPKSNASSKNTKISIAKKEVRSEEENKKYQVDIKGEVISPGIYTLPESARVMDVIEAAGGLTENANTTVINLSKKIADEMVIIIYSNQEVADFKITKQLEAQVVEKCIQKDQEALKNDACISKEVLEQSSEEEAKVSLNQATLEQLMTLPGIGESKALAIINYREEHGGFTEIEEIMQVSGIGESVFEKIKDSITL